MSRALEFLVGWLLNAVAFFDNIRPRHNDDELTAEYRARQRACVWGTALVVLAFIFVVLITSLVDSVSVLQSQTASAEGVRGTLAIVLMAALGSTLTYATYAFWALWRFIRANNDE